MKMISIKVLSIAGVILMINIIEINCHGRLLVPPARSSAWREDPSKFPAFYTDNQMFCGGFDEQWNHNGGKCGICGDDYAGTKDFEKGGSMYRGYIVRTYSQGQTIQVNVELTANHKGYFQFGVCNIDNSYGDATQECLNNNLLTDLYGNSKINIPSSLLGLKTFSLKLPAGLTCNHCVLQWKYNTGNSYGVDPTTGQNCEGCGPQEQFYGCSDIAVTSIYKREWDVPIAPVAPGILTRIPQKRNEDEMTDISVNLLKRLFNELKRLKNLENEVNFEEREENDKEIINNVREYESNTVNDENRYPYEREIMLKNDKKLKTELKSHPEPYQREEVNYAGEAKSHQDFSHKDPKLSLLKRRYPKQNYWNGFFIEKRK